MLVAAIADEACHIYEAHGPIDVILTDVVMPGYSGPELTQQLVKRWPRLRWLYE